MTTDDDLGRAELRGKLLDVVGAVLVRVRLDGVGSVLAA
jgi:hypothetical protein